MVSSNEGRKASKSNSDKNVAHKGIEVKLNNQVSSDGSTSKVVPNSNTNDDLNIDSVAEDMSTSTNAPSISATDTSLVGIVIKNYTQNPTAERKVDCYSMLGQMNLDQNTQAELSTQCRQQEYLPAEEIKINAQPVCPQFGNSDAVSFPCPHVMYPPCMCGPKMMPAFCNNNVTRNGGLKQLWRKSSRVFKGMSPVGSNCDQKKNSLIKNKNFARVIKLADGEIKNKDEKQVQFNKNINSDTKEKKRYKTDKPEKIEMYYFDRGNSAFYQTTDSAPVLITDYYAEKTEISASLFWAELFGIFNIGLAFVTSFILQFCRFLLVGLLRPLTIGLVQLISDYCFKPSLSVAFNGIIQPPLIFLYNILCSLSDLCRPVARGLGYFGTIISNVCRNIRFVEINRQCGDV